VPDEDANISLSLSPHYIITEHAHVWSAAERCRPNSIMSSHSNNVKWVCRRMDCVYIQ